MVASKPPIAKRIPRERTVHGDTVVDDWYWLRDRGDPDTIAYLEAENAYTDEQTEHLAPLRERLFDEIRDRVQETDLSVPAKRGPWWYLTRTEQGRQYPIVCRRSRPDREESEQTLLDANALAGDSPYFALGVVDVSPDHTVLAYSTDHDGDERYVMRFKDLRTGELLADEIPNTSYGSAWAADSRTFFYVTVDESERPHRLWRHALDTHTEDDVLVFQEDDQRFHLGVGLTRSQQLIVLSLESKITTEQHVLDAHEPDGSFRVIEPRRQGVEYSVDQQGDRFVILTNAAGSGATAPGVSGSGATAPGVSGSGATAPGVSGAHPDFAVLTAPVATPGAAHWRELWAPGEGTRITDVDAFADHLVVHYRKGAATHLRVMPNDGEPYDVAFEEEVRTVEPGANHEYETSLFRLTYESLVTPPSVYDFDLTSRQLELRKRQPVLGGFDPASYVSEREWATAPDGTLVPISIVHRRGVPHDGTAPALLYGYGSYEISIDPYFSAIRLPLLDRGFVFAIAHVRGGGELGRAWYEHGKLLEKPNTFTDFVACAEQLCALGYTAPDRLAARGGSAGGLLMGAAANLAPTQFRAIVAEVPFVDALNTILDPTLPLTVTEWEEWGNPIESDDVYRCMKSYAPYENIDAEPYPAMLATAGLNDPRVGYHEPAKWVAKLRHTAPGDRTLLLKTEMGMGHSGPSGRYDAWREQAFVGAFLIDELGAPAEPVYTDRRE